MRANKLKLSPDKTEMLLVGDCSDRMVDVQPVLDGVALPLKEQVRSLGVLLEPFLSLETQVALVAQSASTSFGWWPSYTPIRTGITWYQLSTVR